MYMMSGLMYYKVLLNYIQLCSEFKKSKTNLNIIIQITIHVHSLPWHTGKVFESIDSKSPRVVSSKSTRNIRNFTKRG